VILIEEEGMGCFLFHERAIVACLQLLVLILIVIDTKTATQGKADGNAQVSFFNPCRHNSGTKFTWNNTFFRVLNLHHEFFLSRDSIPYVEMSVGLGCQLYAHLQQTSPCGGNLPF
jgi:hypothetical protein